MPTYDLTNQYISSSFQQLTQISGSVLVDGTGSAINNLTVTASVATLSTSASYAINASSADTSTSASHAVNSDSAISASYAKTASVLLGTITSASHATNADTASFLLGSVATASLAFSASTAISASHAIQADNATTADSATTASHAVQANSSSTSISASHAINSDSSISSSYANNASTADSATEIFVTAKNVQGVQIPKGYAVHASGVTGENVNITTSSYEDSTLMPAIGITQTAINAGATGQVIISGRLQGVNTSNLVAGNPVYVNGDGTLTATKPTGSALIQNIGTAVKINATDGEIIVMGAGRANDVPNLNSGSVLVGNDSSVPTPVLTSSLSVGSAVTATSASHAVQADSASLADNLPTTARLNITDITASNASFTSASIGFLQSITGSAKIIGDAFIVVNNNTPTERYAGISVYDSGSVNTTASLWWDGGTNDWKYQYSSSATHEAAVILTGPEMTEISGAIYPTTNTILKGGGGHHVEDSNITDNGSTISTTIPVSITHNSTVTPGLILNATDDGSSAAPIMEFKRNSASPSDGDYLGQIKFQGENDADQEVLYAKITGKTSDVTDTTEDGLLEFAVKDDGSNSIITRINKNGIIMVNGTFQGDLVGSSSFAETSDTASYLNPLSQDVSITGKFTDTVTATIGNTEEVKNFTYPGFTKTAAPGNGKTYNLNYQGYINFAGFGLGTYENVYLTNQYDSVSYNFGAESLVGGARTHLVLVGSGSTAQAQRDSAFILTDSGDSNATMRIYASEGLIGDRSMDNLLIGNSYNSSVSGRRTQEVSISSEDITIGSAEGWSHNRLGSTVSFSSSTPTKDINFFYTGSMILRQTGSLVAPAIVISGSAQGTVDALSIASNTASLDCRQSDFFTLTLVSGSDTFLNVSNVQSGQSFQVKVAQPTTATDSYGTLSYSTNVKFAAGSAPIITAVSGSEDILTFTAFDSTNVYGTAVQNLS